MARVLRGGMPAGPLPQRLLLRGLPWLLAVALHVGLIALWPAPGRLASAPQAAPAGPVMQMVQLWPAEPAQAQSQRVPAAPLPTPAVQRQAEAAGGLRARQATDAALAAGRSALRAPGRAVDEATPLGLDPSAAANPPAPPGAVPTRGDTATATGAAAPPPVTQAGAPATPLLDTPATRQALRAVATGPSARAMSDAAVGAAKPLSAEERLGRDVARAGRGDCLKGEFFGGGAGLLSLPFWVAAEAQGKCRR